LAAVCLSANALPTEIKGEQQRFEISNVEEDHTKSLVDFYSCAGKVDGNYVHPYDCTKFISCVNQALAYERNCASCNPLTHPEDCPTGRTHYHQPADAWLWAREAGCVTDGPATTTTTTTEGPPPKDCDDDCIQDGHCHGFNTCVDGKWVERSCGDQFWNKDSTSHGGTCDFWDNLPDPLKEEYRNDEECVPTPPLECYLKGHDSCANQYYYLPEGSKNENNGRRQLITCPSSNGVHTYWDNAAQTCMLTCPNEEGCNVC